MRYHILISLLVAVAATQYVSTTQYTPATPSVTVPDEDPESNGSLVCDPDAAYGSEHACGVISSAAASSAAATSVVVTSDSLATSTAAVTSTVGTSDSLATSTVAVTSAVVTSDSLATSTANTDLAATTSSPVAGYTLSDGGYVCNPAHSYPGSQSCDTSGATPTLVNTDSSSPSVSTTSTFVTVTGVVTSATPTYTSWQSSQTGTTSAVGVTTTSGGGWYNYMPTTANPVSVYTGAAASSPQIPSLGFQAAGLVGFLFGSWLV